MLETIECQLEWRSNPSGLLVAFENSKALCDFNDPVAEAQNWAQSIKDLKNDPKIVVIGVGSGFHIEALVEAYPYCEIVAIDCRASITGFNARKFRNVRFLTFDNMLEVSTSYQAEELMAGNVVKVIFSPALGEQAKFLKEIFHFLNIRTREALSVYIGRTVMGPDNIFMNMRHLLENARLEKLPYKPSEILTIREMFR